MPAGKKEELSSMSEYTMCRVQNSVLVDTSVLQFKDHMTGKKSISAMVFFIYKQTKIVKLCSFIALISPHFVCFPIFLYGNVYVFWFLVCFYLK